jgi:hypothetical protein
MISVIVSWLQRGYFLAGTAAAQVFNGPGLEGGVTEAGEIDGPVKATLRSLILNMFYKALSFLALAGVVMVVIAGFYLVLSQGSDESKDKAKKIIYYVILGIIIVWIARSLVGFFLYGLP